MAAGNTYTPIMTTTIGTATPSVVLSSIPSTYTDLVLVVNGSTADATQSISLRFNGDTASNYSRTRLIGDGATPSGERNSTTQVNIGDWGTDRGMVSVNINSYANTSLYKTTLAESGSEGYVSLYSGLWRSNSAINSITFLKNTGANITVGTTLTLYGITAA